MGNFLYSLMIIASQNLTNFDIDLPSDIVFRINLAWVSSIDELIEILKTHQDKKIFLDLPIGRLKPPNNKYSIDDLIPLINEFKQVQYFAVSNVESSSDLQKYVDVLPDYVSIVPKIESPTAVTNIEEIVNTIPSSPKVVMLDHDDMFSSIIRKGESESIFMSKMETLIRYCNEHDVVLLRTVGVIFSDSEKRISQYIK